MVQTEEKQREKAQRSKSVHMFIKIFATFLLIAGIIMSLPLVPGPGLLVIIIALILLGEESKLGQWIISKFPHRVREEIKKRQQKH